MNQHDTTLLPQSLDDLADIANLIGFDLKNAYLTLDAGFDGKINKQRVRLLDMIPVIRPNKKNTKDPEKIKKLFCNFNEQIYKKRFVIERTFAWQDTYRKLVICYEKLLCTHLGFKYLAYSMINLRVLFNKNFR